jgi:hypothetical protein
MELYVPDLVMPAGEARAALAGMPIVLSATHPTPSPRVMLAYRFVQHCNKQMGWWGMVTSDGMGHAQSRVRKRELETQQAKVFNLALNCLGNYFSGKEVQ